jgi:hypothetical protein
MKITTNLILAIHQEVGNLITRYLNLSETDHLLAACAQIQEWFALKDKRNTLRREAA